MKRHHWQSRVAICALISTALPSAVWAEDDAKTGLVAGLALTAASGKTSLGAGAGAIEAGLMGASSFDVAGKIIAGVVNGQNKRLGGAPVAVLAHDEKLDLITPQLVAKRIEQVTTEVGLIDCSHDKTLEEIAAAKKQAEQDAAAAGKAGRVSEFVHFDLGPIKASDFVAAAAVDTTINPIALSTDDRMLVNAVLMNSNASDVGSAGDWLAYKPSTTASATPASWILAAEGTDISARNPIKTGYDTLVSAIDAKRGKCTSDTNVKAVAGADAFVASLGAGGDKGGLSILASAIQLEAIAEKSPLILRVAVEQDGGTAITRSGILYTFGLPGAATVGSGLLVSFRLIDPKTSSARVIGLIRCAALQTNLKKVPTMLASPGTSKCAYRVTML